MQSENTFRVFTEVDAGDASEALRVALEPLRRVLYVANFYHRSAPFRISSPAFVEGPASQQLVPLDAGSVGVLQPQRAATNLAVKFQRSGLLSRLPERVLTSLEQHSVAQTTTDLKVRFVNLWVALETLVGRTEGESIIDRAVSSIKPLIVHRRVNKIIKYLAICLHNFGLCDTIPDSTGWFRRSTDVEIRRDELVLALTCAIGPDVLRQLFQLTAEHPLLCNRLFTVYQSLESGQALAKQLKESGLRAEWQLRRIYRARNLLVHVGTAVTHLPYLLENLEYYFSFALSRVIHDLQRNSDWSVNDSFEYRRIMFEYVYKQAERDASVLTVEDILQGSSDLGRDLLWPPSGAASVSP